MSEPSPDAAPPAVYAQPWAIRFGFAVVVAFTLIVGFAFMDRGRRAQLESTSETTAVGDMAFFAMPDPAKAVAPAAMLNGQALMLVEPKPIEVRDTHLQVAGRDAERGLTVYQLSEAATAAEKTKLPKGVTFLLKTAVNQYVAVRPQAP